MRFLTEDELRYIKSSIVEVLGTKGVKVYIFGSRVRGDSSSRSDLDLAFLSDRDISYELSLLRERFEESNLPVKVDVVDLRRASRDLREEILREGVLWIDTSDLEDT